VTAREPLNDAIDRVARSMTTADPAPELAARVLARLERRTPERQPWMVATAALAVAILAMFVVTVVREVRTPQSATTTLASTQPALEAANDPPDSIDVQAAAPAFESSVPALPPLDPPDAITQDSIQPTKLSIPQLTVEAIVMPPVDGDGSIR